MNEIIRWAAEQAAKYEAEGHIVEGFFIFDDGRAEVMCIATGSEREQRVFQGPGVPWKDEYIRSACQALGCPLAEQSTPGPVVGYWFLKRPIRAKFGNGYGRIIQANEE